MGDVKYWDGSYGKTLDELDTQVKAAASTTGPEREAKLASATQCIKRLQGMKRSYNLEIKLMRDPEQKGIFQEEKNKKDARLTDLEAKLEEIRSKPNMEKATLFSRAVEVPVTKTADQKLDQADAIQNKTEAKYKNMISVLQETEVTASNAAAQLQEDRNKINDITESVMEMEGSMERANKLIRVFGKRMATDKFIQAFGCLNIAALVAIIVYVVVKNVGLPGSSSTTVPPTPGTTTP